MNKINPDFGARRLQSRGTRALCREARPAYSSDRVVGTRRGGTTGDDA
tara:strand:- start:99 stop:242 length:144 start_codon:yes stop_codon:yes gene_type:complete